MFGTKLLADLGADVIKVEPPGGDPCRRRPPFNQGVPAPEHSLYFTHYNANKRSITLDLATPDGSELFLRLVKTADAVLETYPPGYLESLGLGYARLREVNPGIVMTSVTPFGQTGPYRDMQGNDTVCLALGGLVALSGEPNSAPLVAPGELAYGMASSFAALGTLVALYHRSCSGQGQHVDVSVHEASVHIAGYAVPIYSATRRKPFRKSWRSRDFELHDLYPCLDGYARMFVVPRTHWQALVEWLGHPEELMSPVFVDSRTRRENSDIIDPHVARLCRQYTKDGLYQEGQRRHIAVSPMNTPGEFVESRQTRGRGVFLSTEHPFIGPYRHMGPLHRFSKTPAGVRRPAPMVGQHNAEVYCGELGLTARQLSALRAAGAV
ncbi:MAG: CoA transferase [Chloroflexi bacterium]|nr:CoA transferase [Chloroflexota bacterium]